MESQVNLVRGSTDTDRDSSFAAMKVTVQRYPVDVNTLAAEEVGDRIVSTIKQDSTGCVYFNPAARVFCLSASQEFFRVVRREQSRWCRQASHIFPRRVRRKASRWVTSEVISDKHIRYLDRALLFTGVLFINGRLILPHNWPVPVADSSKLDSPEHAHTRTGDRQ